MHAHGEPNPLPAFKTVQPDGVTLTLKVAPRAPRDEIGKPTGTELRVKVTSPPVDAAANEAVLRLLAETFDCPRNKVQLLRGQTSRHKVVKVYWVTAEHVLSKLA